MVYETTVTYSRQIIRYAIRRFWFRFIAWHGFLAIGLGMLGCVVLWCLGRRSWELGAMGAFTAIAVSLAGAVYVTHLRRSMWKFNRMPSKQVQFRFSDDRFSSMSELGASDVAWGTIERIWRFDNAWLLFVSKTVYMILPITQLDEPMRQFLVERVKSSGGRVE